MSTPLNILITGSSSGFGDLTTRTLAENGHVVFASMRGVDGKNADQAADLRAWADEHDHTVHVVELDVTDEASVDAAVQTVIDTAGRIDVVVNNAGVGSFGINEAYTLDQAHTLFDVNVFGVLRVNRAVLPHMRRQQSGLIVNVSSGLGRVVFPFTGIYNASKWALEALVETSRYELANLGIDAVLVEPGAYGTSFGPNMMAPDDAERAAGYGGVAETAQQFAEGLMASLDGPDAPDPQEVADAIAHLVDTPAGERPLRTPVGNMHGIAEINRLSKQVQTQLLAATGLAHLGQVETEASLN